MNHIKVVVWDVEVVAVYRALILFVSTQCRY